MFDLATPAAVRAEVAKVEADLAGEVMEEVEKEAAVKVGVEREVVATVEDGSGMGAYTVQADVMPAGSNKYALGGVTYRGGVESFSQACASRRLADDYSQMPSWLWHGRHKKLAR